MNNQSKIKNFFRRHSVIPWIIGLAGVAFTIMALALTQNNAIRDLEKHFQTETKTRANLIQIELIFCADNLEYISTFIANTRALNRNVFQSLTAAFLSESPDFKPTGRMIKWVPVVNTDRRDAYETETRREWDENFQITEQLPDGRYVRAGYRETHYPVHYLEPFEGNEARIGNDFGSKADHRQAIEAAITSGKATTSDRVKLDLKNAGQFGFYIYQPVYKRMASLETVEQRKRAIRGLIIGVFYAGDVVENALKPMEESNIDIDIIDATSQPGKSVIHQLKSKAGFQERWHFEDFVLPSLEPAHYEFDVLGKTWRISFTPSKDFIREHTSATHWIFLPVGLLFALVLALFIRRVLTEKQRVEGLVEERSREIFESEKRFRTFADFTFDWEYWISPNNKFIYTSPSCIRITGFSARKFYNEPGLLTDIIHPDDKYLFEEHNKDIAGRKRSSELEFRIIHHDGGVRWIAHVCHSLHDENGSFIGVRASNRDITEKRKVDLLLKESLELNNTILNASPVGIIAYEVAGGQCVQVNDAAARITNATRDQLLAQNFRQLDSWKKSGLLEAAERAISTGNEQRLNVETTTTFGRAVRVACYFSIFMTGGEKHLMFLFEDLSDKAKFEAELQRAEDDIRKLVESSPLPMMVMQGDGRNVVFHNHQFREVIGYDLNTHPDINHWFSSVFPDEKYRQEIVTLWASQVQKAKEENQSIEPMETVIICSDGRTRIFEVHLSQIGNRNLVVFVDLTERQKNKMELEMLLSELTQKNKDLESIVYAASHDLRAPLVNIAGFSHQIYESIEELEEAASGVKLPPEALKLMMETIPQSLEFIEASSLKMEALINGLLKLSRSGRSDLQSAKINMDDMFRNIISSMKYQIEESNAEINVEKLPGCFGDINTLNQVFSNLVDNAMKYRNPEKPLKIKISGRKEKNAVIYCVQDNGQGIKKESLGTIWELFRRFDPSGKIPGDGLGLTLVKKIVERHMGRVWAESEEGRGSRFFVELPRKEE